MNYLSDFFHRSMVEKLNYHYVMLDVVEGEHPKRLIRTWDHNGMELMYLDGSPGGDMAASHMPYWQIVSLRRKIPRGNIIKFITLELT